MLYNKSFVCLVLSWPPWIFAGSKFCPSSHFCDWVIYNVAIGFEYPIPCWSVQWFILTWLSPWAILWQIRFVMLIASVSYCIVLVSLFAHWQAMDTSDATSHVHLTMIDMYTIRCFMLCFCISDWCRLLNMHHCTVFQKLRSYIFCCVD